MRFRPIVRAPLAALGLLLAAVLVRAQQAPPPAPPPSPVIARVEGRPITQEEFDRVARPYYDQLRAEMKQGFTDEVRKHAAHNVLNELIRREVLVVEAQRQKLPITEAETDRILRQDPFFHTNGRFDPSKLVQYKLNPGTNYLAVLPRLRELAGAGKMDSVARARATPSAAAVRAEWAQRNDQVRFKFLSLAMRDVSLEPEATPDEVRAYYEAHPDQFERRPRARLRYLKLPVPGEGDPARDSLAAAATARARPLADSLRAGAELEALADTLGGVHDSGLFDLPAVQVPGLGRVPELTAQLAGAEADTGRRVIGPALAGDAVVVGVVAERQPKTLPPLAEVMPDAKRRADQEKRRTHAETERREFFAARRDRYRTSRASITRVVAGAAEGRVRAPAARDVERWYAARGRSFLALADTIPLPPLDDALRRRVGAELEAEGRRAAAGRALATLAQGWRAGRDVRALARAQRAAVETLSLIRGGDRDSLFPAPLVDSLLAGQVRAGAVEGPRAFGERVVVWRLDAVDTTVVPEFEAVRAQVEQDFAEERRVRDEEEGRAWYEAHRADYRTKPRYVVDYVRVRVPPPDSVRIADAEVRRHYDRHLDTYRQEEQVRARHLLIGTRPGQTPEAVARARADSLRAALAAGADFADLARRFSHDTGSGAEGGDLGFFTRERMVKEFSDTAFALEPGRVSQPVKTQYGWHLIRVDEKKPAGVRPFEEVREEIRRQLAQTRGDSTASRTADQMRRRIGRGESAAVVAAAAGGVQTPTPFAAAEALPGVGVVPGLSTEIDSLRVGRWAPKTYRFGDSYLLLRVKERIPAAPAEFAEVRAQAIEDARTAKKKELMAGKVEAIRSRLAAGAPLDSVAGLHGGLRESGLLHRSSTFVPFIGAEPRVIRRAFDLARGRTSDTLTTAQGVVWIRVEERKTQEGASLERDRAAIRQELQQKAYTEWLERRKASMRIEILRADLREKPKPLTQTFTVGR